MKALSILMVFFLSSLSFAVDKDYAGLIKWHSLKAGKERAKMEKKPMIIDFSVAEGCQRCEAMQKNIYSKKEIADKINKEFIPVRIDLAKELSAEERKLGEEYDFKNDCLLLFLDSDGRIIKDPTGKRLCFMDAVDAEVFLKYLDYIKEGVKKN